MFFYALFLFAVLRYIFFFPFFFARFIVPAVEECRFLCRKPMVCTS